MKSLQTTEEVIELINSGKILLLAGDNKLMESLPKGNWIGGSIPYFMGDEGGVVAKDKILVELLPDVNTLESIKTYGPSELQDIAKDYPENGASFIILPVFSEVHALFAKDVMSYDGVFNSPLVGWVAGVHLNDFETEKPKIYNGLTGESHEDKCIIMHAALPEDMYGKIEIVNIFDDDTEDVIQFPGGSTIIKECTVNGESMMFADYVKSKNHDTQQPLIGDFMGAKLNVAFQSIDEETKEVHMYAPLFNNIDYRLSTPIESYQDSFVKKLDEITDIEPAFSCNCVLNFLYGELEGKSTGKLTGPMTFGEIAYVLLNQTMVYMTYHKK